VGFRSARVSAPHAVAADIRELHASAWRCAKTAKEGGQVNRGIAGHRRNTCLKQCGEGEYHLHVFEIRFNYVVIVRNFDNQTLASVVLNPLMYKFRTVLCSFRLEQCFYQFLYSIRTPKLAVEEKCIYVMKNK
jgi:hypothetical protein